jgi:outer membrane immunogenic protein
MKRILLGGFAISALLISGPLSIASAADMAVKAPPPAPAPVFSWTGFYIGVDGGADWSNNSWFAPNTPINVAGGCLVAGCNYSVGGHSSSSWLFGGLVGFNYQINKWVLGVEAQGDWTKLQGSNVQPVAPGITDISKTNSLETIAGRVGVTWDRTLLYAKGGLAKAHDTFFTTLPFCLPTICQTVSDTRSGWIVGAGVEQALTPNWSVKLEYDHMDFGNSTETLQAVCAGCGTFQYNIRQTVDLIDAAIMYHFNWFALPVAAKN